MVKFKSKQRKVSLSQLQSCKKNTELIKKARVIMEKKKNYGYKKNNLTVEAMTLMKKCIDDATTSAFFSANRKGLFPCDYEYHFFIQQSFNTSMGSFLEKIVGLNKNILNVGKGIGDKNSEKIKAVDILMYHNGILTAIDMKTSSNTTSGTFVKTFNSMLNEMSYDMKAYKATAFYKWHERIGSLKDKEFLLSPEVFWEKYVGMEFKPLQELFNTRYIKMKKKLKELKSIHKNGKNNIYI